LNRISDIHSILIPLFEKFPLNGTKYLDYLAFKNAVETKLDSSIPRALKLEIITALKNSINSNRVDFEMPSTHTIRITPYYLLGLFEGEGSFSFNKPKTMGISFTISLTAAQLPLMNAVKNYLISNYLDITHLKS
jgi:hypothetical protein